MKKSTYILFPTLLVLLTSFITVNNKDVDTKPHLFKIERSKDANEIFYDINLEKTGTLSITEPIYPYWRRQTEGGAIKPLTWIQQHYAYGLEYVYASGNYAKFHFVSYKKRDFVLKKNASGDFKVFTQLNNKEVEVNRIFIQIDGGTFWFPKISKVELHTKEAVTNKNIVEIIKP
ncbi:MAG: DUF4833 domain-containing protein [Flavobacteriales bacterium CG_4_10_14_0_2_um_filter_32_8]|nr:MAG: DUF4833 domain-containing protein [Flavobacteriales bacterium CG_4_10_14_0_2_um_filter_32_8]PJB15303.1 MAG: DUF4833 domain-containing protein [Flavobacteriales bacterium CG_4_9_14_3_um_filter_32_8]